MSSVVIKSILEMLSKNKQFPNYQAERRIDIFVNHFLNRILTIYMREKVEYLCPEFPLKKQYDVETSKTKNLSTKLDYLCCTRKEIIFVELKTDSSSINPKQLDIYFKNTNWDNCLLKLKEIVDVKGRDKLTQNKYEKLNKVVQSRTKKFDNSVTKIRIIYLSPINKKQRTKIGSFSVLKLKSFKHLGVKLENPEEELIWKFLVKHKMDIFEVTDNKNNKIV